MRTARIKRFDYWLMQQRYRVLAFLKTVGQGRTAAVIESRGNTRHAPGPRKHAR